ncbi:DUF1737 domain-containing protein [Klebsiella pneumoniae]|uniref:DUF1737 domain-containing protein n=1 Tax=Klebsiella pneumoniae TaxID=573 RepID=UPI0024AEF62B|nr:DUF1737 domain-containing protein [Klebsiella pneumoniae]MDI7104466.1 DUF1737 domain-containing protein [Klebsiella pneumoniae]
MLEYKVIHKPNIKLLEAHVNEALKEGWTLQGGVAVNAYDNYQALVREIPTPVEIPPKE